MATKPANKTLLADAPEEAKKRDVQPKRGRHSAQRQKMKMKMKIFSFFYYIYFRFSFRSEKQK